MSANQLEVQLCQLRLAVVMIMKGRSDHFIAWFALKCSSWGAINRGTSGRSAAASTGRGYYRSVEEANKMLERLGSCKSIQNHGLGIPQNMMILIFLFGFFVGSSNAETPFP